MQGIRALTSLISGQRLMEPGHGVAPPSCTCTSGCFWFFRTIPSRSSKREITHSLALGFWQSQRGMCVLPFAVRSRLVTVEMQMACMSLRGECAHSRNLLKAYCERRGVISAPNQPAGHAKHQRGGYPIEPVAAAPPHQPITQAATTLGVDHQGRELDHHH